MDKETQEDELEAIYEIADMDHVRKLVTNIMDEAAACFRAVGKIVKDDEERDGLNSIISSMVIGQFMAKMIYILDDDDMDLQMEFQERYMKLCMDALSKVDDNKEKAREIFAEITESLRKFTKEMKDD